MRAALSLSLSSVVGQKASEPSLLDRRLTGGPNLSTQPYTLSKPALLLVFVFAHMLTVALGQLGNGWGAGIINWQTKNYTTRHRADIDEARSHGSEAVENGLRHDRAAGTASK